MMRGIGERFMLCVYAARTYIMFTYLYGSGREQLKSATNQEIYVCLFYKTSVYIAVVGREGTELQATDCEWRQQRRDGGRGRVYLNYMRARIHIYLYIYRDAPYYLVEKEKFRVHTQG